ncbi:MAG: TAXI family TRAP transporter solute-binding subunit [Pseudomonadota bacterium]|nr:TAXI family TRAP transporter solute-binding subunit [Pseudomonadota bacterium]
MLRTVAACLLALLAANATRAEEAVTATVGGISAGGFFALIGNAIGEMVQREYPGSSLVYEPGNQAGQLVKLAADRIEMVIASPLALSYARAGRSPFPAPIPLDKLRVLAQLTDGMTLFVVGSSAFLDEHDISTLRDFARQRAPVRTYLAARGNLLAQALMLDGVFLDAGFTARAIASWGGKAYYINSGEAKRLMLDRKLDLFPSTSFHPDAKVLEISRGLSVRAVPIDSDLVDRTALQLQLPKVTVPVGTYEFLRTDYETLAVPMYLLTSAQLPDEVAYRVARSLYRQLPYYHALHPALANYEVGQLVQSGNHPLHPGARRFYSEVGLVP